MEVSLKLKRSKALTAEEPESPPGLGHTHTESPTPGKAERFLYLFLQGTLVA